MDILKAVFLDSHTLQGEDLDLQALSDFLDIQVYQDTNQDELYERVKHAEIIISNKVYLGSDLLSRLAHLKYIQVAATGYNNVDLNYCRSNNIKVSNVAGYSTTSVTQHVFACILHALNRLHQYFPEFDQKRWARQKHFSYYDHSIQEIAGKKIGVIGLGTIGQNVANVAQAFGAEVISIERGKEHLSGVRYMDFESLLQESDIVSLHLPLTESSKHIINEKALSLMKDSATLINTARGGHIDYDALKHALETHAIAAAYLDVLEMEPPSEDHILYKTPNCYVSPHQAWASYESRQRLLREMILNIKAFQRGEDRNSII